MGRFVARTGAEYRNTLFGLTSLVSYFLTFVAFRTVVSKIAASGAELTVGEFITNPIATLGIDSAGFTKVGPFWDTDGYNVLSNTHGSAVPAIWTSSHLAEFCTNGTLWTFNANVRIAIFISITRPIDFAWTNR
jgi:hypothetical protein